MIRPALGTVSARAAIAVVNLLVVAIASRALGLEGVGRMSLLLLAITFILLLSNLPAIGLVYLEPRHGTRTLRRLSYAWAAASCLAAYPLAAWLGIAPDGLAAHACAIAFIETIANVNLNLLLGRERFGLNNALHVLRTLLILVCFAVLLNRDGPDVMDYAYALYAAQAATALISAGMLARQPGQRSDAWAALVALLRQGLPGQMANGLQLLTYRLSYYFVDRLRGASALGLWSITTQLAESAWMAPKSLGTVLYARVSNMQEGDAQRALTLTVLKTSVALALLAALVLLALPEALFQWAFGREVAGVKRVVALLLPGLLAMAASQALSHFFSGSGRVHHNTIASGAGLLVTVAGGLLLIPAYGIDGAAITASAAYLLAACYQGILFKRITGARWRQWLPDGSDAHRLRAIWSRLRRG